MRGEGDRRNKNGSRGRRRRGRGKGGRRGVAVSFLSGGTDEERGMGREGGREKEGLMKVAITKEFIYKALLSASPAASPPWSVPLFPTKTQSNQPFPCRSGRPN